METGNFLFNVIWGREKNEIISNLEMPAIIKGILECCHFYNFDYKLIKFECAGYEIILRKIGRFENKTIYNWKCTYVSII